MGYFPLKFHSGKESDEILVSLQQKHRRKQKNEGIGLLAIGFAVYKIVNPDGEFLASMIDWPNERPVYSSTFACRRDLTVKFNVGRDSGEFAIIPSTFDQDEEGHFFMRIFVEQESPEEEDDDFDESEFSFW